MQRGGVAVLLLVALVLVSAGALLVGGVGFNDLDRGFRSGLGFVFVLIGAAFGLAAWALRGSRR